MNSIRLMVLGLTVVLFPLSAKDKDTLPLKSKTTADPKSGSIIAPKKPPVAQLPEAPEDGPVIGSIGTYGSSRLNEVILRELLGKDLDVWVAKGLASDPSALDLEKKFVEKVKKKFGFVFTEWSIIQYFEPSQLSLHLTLDVVEKDDAARRMPFEKAPSGKLDDPGGLIAQWEAYENQALDLIESGELEPEAEKCVALHCPFGHAHPKLKKYESVFMQGVKKHADALEKVLNGDERGERRAAAAYLLAYQPTRKKQVVEALLGRLRDPDALVRNNALRVLGDIAEFHTDTPIPFKQIVPALEYPKVSDRSKALYVLYLMSLNSKEVRTALLKESVPVLIQLMESKQPDHRELAHNILRKLSGKEFPDTDARAWTAWYDKLAKEREISKAK